MSQPLCQRRVAGVVDVGAHDGHRHLVDYPGDGLEDQAMRISHEAIYQALYVQGRGALRRELTACLRTGRALRVPRARSRRRGKSFVTPEIMISERSAEAADRAVPGHWEGDLIIGLGRSAIGTLVERTTRFTMLLHLWKARHRPAREERACACRSWGSGSRCHRPDDHDMPAQLRRSRPGTREQRWPGMRICDRNRPSRLLLRTAQPLATRNEREH